MASLTFVGNEGIYSMGEGQESHTQKSSKQNVLRLSRGKALPAKHSRKRQPGMTLQLLVMCSTCQNSTWGQHKHNGTKPNQEN